MKEHDECYWPFEREETFITVDHGENIRGGIFPVLHYDHVTGQFQFHRGAK